MPAAVKRNRNGGWDIYNRRTGEVYGHSKTRRDAQKSANARNAASHGWEPTR